MSQSQSRDQSLAHLRTYDIMTYDIMTLYFMTHDVMINDMGRLGQSDFSFRSAVHNSNFWAWLSSATLRFLIDPKNIKTQKNYGPKIFTACCLVRFAAFFGAGSKFSQTVSAAKRTSNSHTHTPVDVFCTFPWFGLIYLIWSGFIRSILFCQ